MDGCSFDVFLANLLFRFNLGDRSLAELGKISRTIKVKANLAFYLRPAAFNLIENAFSRVSVIGGDFHLWLLENLLGCRDVRESFERLDLSLPEFSQKLEAYLQGSLSERSSPKILLEKIEKLILSAYQEAVLANESFIEPRNILVALFQCQKTNRSLDRKKNELKVDGSSLTKLFNLFNLSADDLKGSFDFRALSSF